ncbi:hypothetical protein Purlil1_13836 [Purpureocillium lilacinum]|uniref:Uncharacterized protein n=1 Tax=Purpureocillium lilacinum TaxID=33203 RepID=A0ABR0BCY8_PURLI|nr:hypothetical protein Purlil1_13836 [Purpureocillium lilacinum]
MPSPSQVPDVPHPTRHRPNSISLNDEAKPKVFDEQGARCLHLLIEVRNHDVGRSNGVPIDQLPHGFGEELEALESFVVYQTKGAVLGDFTHAWPARHLEERGLEAVCVVGVVKAHHPEEGLV